MGGWVVDVITSLPQGYWTHAGHEPEDEVGDGTANNCYNYDIIVTIITSIMMYTNIIRVRSCTFLTWIWLTEIIIMASYSFLLPAACLGFFACGTPSLLS